MTAATIAGSGAARAFQSMTLLVLIVLALASDPSYSSDEAISLDQHVTNLAAPSGALQIQAEEAIMASTQAALAPLIRGLSSQSPLIRRKAMFLLQRIGPAAAADLIVTISQSDPIVSMRSMAIRTLPCLGRPELSNIARGQVRPSEHVVIRRSAIMTVAKMDGQKARSWLEERLLDRPASIAVRAALELAVLGSTSGYSVAIQCLTDPDWVTSMEAAQTLERLGIQDSLPALLRAVQSPATGIGSRSEILQAIKHIEFQSIPVGKRSALLRDGLASDTIAIRVWAANELGNLGSPDAIAILKEAVERENHPGVKEAFFALQAAQAAPDDSCR